MNFCYQTAHRDKDHTILHNLKARRAQAGTLKEQQLLENCPKIVMPYTIARSSSLSKISHSNTKRNQLSEEKKSEEVPNKNKFIDSKCKENSQEKNTHSFFDQRSNLKAKVKQTTVSKLLQKNQVTIKAGQETRNKENYQQKQKNDRQPPQHFYHKHQNVNKLLQVYKEKTQRQLKQCTFNPKVNIKNHSKSKNIKEFYNGQIQYSKKVGDKIQEMRSLIQAQKYKQNTFQPKISKQTGQLTQKREHVNVYERLYPQQKQDRYHTQSQNSCNDQQMKTRRQKSKNSITLASSSKKKLSAYSKQQANNQSIKKYSDFMQNKSKQLVRQRSLNCFSETDKRKQAGVNSHVQANQAKQTINKNKSKCLDRFKDLNFKQNSQNKANLQKYGLQMLDCRQIIRQKQRTNALILRERSCKLSSKQKNGQLIQNKHELKEKTNLNDEKQRQIQRNKFSQRNQKITLQKFTKEFFTIIQKLNLSEKITFSEMLMLLNKMNFIEKEYEFQQYYCHQGNQKQTKIQEIWSILEGNQKNYVFSKNIFKLFCAIIGFHRDSFINQSLKKVSNYFQTLKNDNTNQKILILSQKDSKAIKKDFISFHLTRFKLGQSKLISKQVNGNEYSFKPYISKESEQYAQKYRERVIFQSQKLINQGSIDFKVPENGLIDHSALLILDQKIKNYNIQQKRKSTEQQKRKSQDQSMIYHSYSRRQNNDTSRSIDQHKNSFRNQDDLNSNKFSHISHIQSLSRSKDQIFVELYENGKKSKTNKRDKSAGKIEYEQSKNQSVLMPKINQFKKSRQSNSQKQQIIYNQNIPNYTKQVMKMRKNNNITSKQNLSTSPLLYLNVEMEGNINVKVPVYQNDTLQSVTQKVRILMNIQNDQFQIKKLQQILIEQIIPALDKLGINKINNSFLLAQ